MYLFVCAYECRCLWRWIWGKCPGVSELPQMGAGNWAKVLLKNSASLNWEALSPTLTLLLALWCLSLLLLLSLSHHISLTAVTSDHISPWSDSLFSEGWVLGFLYLCFPFHCPLAENISVCQQFCSLSCLLWVFLPSSSSHLNQNI